MIEYSCFRSESYECHLVAYRWDLESIIGHHYSLSYGLKQFLEGYEDEFEKEVKQILGKINPSGEFLERRKTKIEIGRNGHLS